MHRLRRPLLAALATLASGAAVAPAAWAASGGALTGAAAASGGALTGAAAASGAPLAGAAAPAGPAHAWQCRASAGSLTLAGGAPAPLLRAGGGGTFTEPLVVGSAGACATAARELRALPYSAALPASVITAGPLAARTAVDRLGPPGPVLRVTAASQVENVVLRLSPGARLVTVMADAAVARVTAACVRGRPRLLGASTLRRVTVDGVAVPAADLAARLSALLRPLGADAEVRLGEELHESSAVTRRALRVRLLGPGGVPLLEAVVGEARVAPAGAGCAGAAGGRRAPAALRACPDGSELDAPSGLCVIRAAIRDVLVAPPFAGPSGGRVVTVAEARVQHRGRCLRGRRAPFAILGTAGPDRITGTPGPDRILALGGDDRVRGGPGADCLDGGPGTDRLVGGPGRDTLRRAG
jgi:hypothetical protein